MKIRSSQLKGSLWI